ncbi:MAG: permease [Pseudomonadota bacterium]
MAATDIVETLRPTARRLHVLAIGILLALAAWQPGAAWDTVWFVCVGLIHVAPMVIPGVVLAAWLASSGAGDHVATVFQGRMAQTIVLATVVGAFLPVCGVTVLPLMAGLLAARVPLAPVMAFWLASPITGPAMLSATVATLGWEYAIGKSAAAIGLGLFGGAVTALLSRKAWALDPLRSNRIVGSLRTPCGAGTGAVDVRIWASAERRARFLRDSGSTTRLIILVLIPAFAAEFWLNALLEPNAVAAYVGRESSFAVPLAVLVGGPAYIDGYAAMPLTRALLEHGMSPGAAMAFMISGGVMSIWGAMAIAPVLRLKPFLLYLCLAVTGSMLAGWAFGALV